MSASNIINPNDQKINLNYLPNPYPYPAQPNGLGAVLTVDNRAGDQDITGLRQLEAVSVVQQPVLGSSLTIGSAGGDLRITGATTKGSVLAGNGTSTVGLPVGATGYVLKSNPATATGLEWGIDISGVTGVVGVNAGANIDISGTVSQPIVSLQNPLTSTLALGSQSMTAGDPLIPLTFNSTTDKNGVTYNEGAILSANYSANSMSIVNTTGIGSLQATSGSITLADTSVGTSTVNNISTPTDIQVTSLDNIGGGIQRTTVGDNDITILNTDAGTPIVTKTSVYGCCFASENAIDVSTSESATHTITTNANGITESSLVQGGGTSITTSATTATTGAGFSRQWGDVTGNQTSIGTNQNGVSASSSNGVVSTISGTLTSISTQIASDTTSARETVSYSQISPAGLTTFVQSTADNVRSKTRHTYIPTPSGPLTLVDTEAGAGGCVLRHTASAVVTDITTSTPFGTIMSGSDAITVQSVGNLNLNSTGASVGMSGQGVTIQSSSSLIHLNSPASNIQYSSSTGQQVIVSSANSVTVPTYTITNTNASNASYPAIKMDRPTPASVAGDQIAGLTFWADDGSGNNREWGRISAFAQNTTASPANQDGRIGVWTSINGATPVEVFNFNGADNENNSFRPLDVNNNALKTSTGSLTLDATASSGTGHVIIQPKTGAEVQIPGAIATLSATTGQLNIQASTNVNLSGNFNTYSSTSSTNIVTPLLTFTGAGLQSATAGGNSGQHLVITLNGTVYKIALLNP